MKAKRQELTSFCFLIVLLFVSCSKENNSDTIRPNKETPIQTFSKNKAVSISKKHHINIDMEELPENYTGTNNIMLFNSVASNIRYQLISKSEFETTQEFEIRRKEEEAKLHLIKLIDNKTVDSLFTISWPHFVEYDADNSAFNIRIKTGGNLLWSSWGITPDTPLAHENYNASKVIQLSSKESQYDAYKKYLVRNADKFSRNKEFVDIKLKIGRDKAVEEKNNINAVATVELVYPYQWQRYSNVHELANTQYVFIKVIQFWIYNSKSGEVYKKVRPR